MSATAPSDRVRVRRVPKRAVYDREVIDAILDEAFVAHLGFCVHEQPYVVPTLHARIGDTLYVHGSSASRTVRRLAAGVPACVTVSLVDGLVLARAAFHHSMNYRSVVVLGTMRLVTGEEERVRALEAFTERLMPGRWSEVRPPSEQELRATQVLSIALDECSAKVRTGGPVDDADDMDSDAWAGVVPLRLTPGAPEPDPAMPATIPPSSAVTAWLADRAR